MEFAIAIGYLGILLGASILVIKGVVAIRPFISTTKKKYRPIY